VQIWPNGLIKPSKSFSKNEDSLPDVCRSLQLYSLDTADWESGRVSGRFFLDFVMAVALAEPHANNLNLHLATNK